MIIPSYFARGFLQSPAFFLRFFFLLFFKSRLNRCLGAVAHAAQVEVVAHAAPAVHRAVAEGIERHRRQRGRPGWRSYGTSGSERGRRRGQGVWMP